MEAHMTAGSNDQMREFEEWISGYFVDPDDEDKESFLDCWQAAYRAGHAAALKGDKDSTGDFSDIVKEADEYGALPRQKDIPIAWHFEAGAKWERNRASRSSKIKLPEMPASYTNMTEQRVFKETLDAIRAANPGLSEE